MHVRLATFDDCDAISRIATRTFPMACPADTPKEELERYIAENLTAASFRAALNNPDKTVRVLEKSAEPIGFSLVNDAPERIGIALADDIPELTRCYVDAAHHGTGAAQFLMTATLADISRRIRLTVNDQNARAIRFYQRNGFRIVGETRFRCGGDIHRDLVMTRESAGHGNDAAGNG